MGLVAVPSWMLMLLDANVAAISYFAAASLMMLYYFKASVFSIISLCVTIIGTMISGHFVQLLHSGWLYSLGKLAIAAEVLAYGFLFSLLVFLYKRYVYDKFHDLELPWYVQTLLVVILLGTIAVVYFNMFNSPEDDSNRVIAINLLMQIGYFFSIMVLCSLLFLYISKHNAMRRKQFEQEQFLHYMKELEAVNHNMHTFRHDYVNILLTIRGFLDDNNMEGLRRYFHDHIMKVEQQTLQHNLMFIQFKNIKIQELKGLIATKLIAAEKNKIVVNVQVPDLITTIDMNIIDLARVIGILLDNAIEASECTDQPCINLALLHTIEGSIVIIIENRAEQQPAPVEQLFEENFSTKGKHRGIGLATVRKIVNQHPNVHLETVMEKQWFTQKLTIRKAVATGSA
ncbi:histidine kinase [Paenibacillus montaniterrae]|uniref:Histidine kinase n=1 Tax=Paenibacillus montaniterrae TaxID=429341 RepID=A0A919YRR4_9BACL|nr:GHKL domain-containing protein [Paenibacillus montaniterrae]GIP18027.1 histidine kinase [Paenibacillus montaniterrae]